MVEEQRQLALNEGGEAAARICQRQGMRGSGKTLLRSVCHAPLPVRPTPRVLGVDDWAMSKGRTYGTILVDLELHQPVDLLADRTSASLEQWLKEHPGVEIISRDRANDYAEGSRCGAPTAVQVADRFHLIKNIREMLERLLERNYISLKKAADQVTQALNADEASLSISVSSAADAKDVQFEESAPAQMAPTISSYEQLREQHRTKRLTRYTEVRKLQAEGMGIRAIARQLKMSRDSVRRFMSDQFPERARRARRQSKLDPYVPYLTQQLTAGRSNALQLFRELQTLHGYSGARGLVSIWVAAHRSLCPPKSAQEPRKGGRPPGLLPKPKPAYHTPSSRRTSWLVLATPEEMTTDDASFVDKLYHECPDIRTVQMLALDFTQMLKDRNSQHLNDWIEQARASSIPELVNFVNALCRDHAAVAAALTLEISNGQVEGQVNRLKLIKRSGYGRASFQLLKRRVLAA